MVPVDSYAGVQSAYAGWNEDPCSVPAANDVVSAISSVVDDIESSHPGIQNVVIVGADDQIPFARVVDGASQANERDYGTSTFQGEDNVEAAALSLGYYFSDDPYVSSNPLGVGSATLYTPRVAVGRLVESAAEIDGALTRFLNSHGNLSATASLTTGYSFLTGGAEAVSANLANDGLKSVGDLINEQWDTSDLDSALASTIPGAPTDNQVDSINAHFDYSRALPAIDDTNGTEDDLFTTADVESLPQASQSTYVGSLLFSMGCHAGLSIDDSEVAISGVTTPVDDWAKTFADSGSLWIANTGYGYADSATIAYSARLMALFAGNLGSDITIGEALAQAKQQYSAGNAILSPYDLKAVMESTFYGLPMYHLNGSTGTGGTAPASAGPLGTDTVSGLSSLPFAADNTTFAPTSPTGQTGTYYQATSVGGGFEAGLQSTEYRPIEPLLSRDVSEPGYVAHGALITTLASSDASNFTPQFSLPAVGTQNSVSPEIGQAAFPGTLQRVAAYDTFTSTGTAQGNQLDLIAGQFFPNPTAPGQGTERLYSSIDGEVLYQPVGRQLAGDFDPPTIDSSQAGTSGTAASGWNVGFSVQVTPSSSADTVKEVVVLYTDASNPGTWTTIDLANPSGDGLGWTASTALPNADDVQFVVEAVDAAGNVAVSNNEGADFDGVPQPAVVVSLAGTGAGNGSYLGSVTATVTAPTGSTYVLDGAAPAPIPPGGQIEVSSVGTHILTVTGSDSATDVVTRSFSISPTPTSVALSSSSPSAVVGQAVTFQATVAAVGTPGSTPTGTVEFFDGTNPIDAPGCGTLGQVGLGAGVATCSTSYTTPTFGDQITATYIPAPGSGFAGSATTAALIEVVGQASTTTSLAESGPPGTPAVGQTQAYVATVGAVSPGAGAPSGYVEFLDGSTPIASCGAATGSSLQPASSPGHASTATCSLTFTTGGTHDLSAVYFGDPSFSGSSDSATPVAQSVSTATPGAEVDSTVNPVELGEPVTFTANLSGPAVPGAVAPGGTVTFYDSLNGAPLACGSEGTVDLSEGGAQCQTELLAVGTHNVYFTYSGDSNYSAVASSSVSEVVDQATPGVSLSTSGSPVAIGDQVTFTATVAGVAGAATPGGTVEFLDGADILSCNASSAPVAVSNGSASCVTSFTGAGGHYITAQYSGDSSYLAATSTAVTETVDEVSTTASTHGPGRAGGGRRAHHLFGDDHPDDLWGGSARRQRGILDRRPAGVVRRRGHGHPYGRFGHVPACVHGLGDRDRDRDLHRRQHFLRVDGFAGPDRRSGHPDCQRVAVAGLRQPVGLRAGGDLHGGCGSAVPGFNRRLGNRRVHRRGFAPCLRGSAVRPTRRRHCHVHGEFHLGGDASDRGHLLGRRQLRVGNGARARRKPRAGADIAVGGASGPGGRGAARHLHGGPGRDPAGAGRTGPHGFLLRRRRADLL